MRRAVLTLERPTHNNRDTVQAHAARPQTKQKRTTAMLGTKKSSVNDSNAGHKEEQRIRARTMPARSLASMFASVCKRERRTAEWPRAHAIITHVCGQRQQAGEDSKKVGDIIGRTVQQANPANSSSCRAR